MGLTTTAPAKRPVLRTCSVLVVLGPGEESAQQFAALVGQGSTLPVVVRRGSLNAV
jgi:hypothetical protein